MAAFLPPVPTRPLPGPAPAPSLSIHRRQGRRDDSPPTGSTNRTATAGWDSKSSRTSAEDRLQWRNALVEANLPLVRAVVARTVVAGSGRRSEQPYDDLVQVGSLGLIRAVEAFDPNRAVSFSSFAVPYIRGAILHDWRDRQAMVRIPRSLWDLRQQASRLQEEQRKLGLQPLAQEDLAKQLGCGQHQLEEISGLGAASRPRSLDAPLASTGVGQETDGATLLDCLADPRSLTEAADERSGSDKETAEEQRWLRERLAALDPQRRQLVEGRLTLGCSWVELGRKLGIHPRMAQRRCDATLHDLRIAADQWRQERKGGATS